MPGPARCPNMVINSPVVTPAAPSWSMMSASGIMLPVESSAWMPSRSRMSAASPVGLISAVMTPRRVVPAIALDAGVAEQTDRRGSFLELDPSRRSDRSHILHGFAGLRDVGVGVGEGDGEDVVHTAEVCDLHPVAGQHVRRDVRRRRKIHVPGRRKLQHPGSADMVSDVENPPTPRSTWHRRLHRQRTWWTLRARGPA
jgi:hypothetical protein